jgi:predicted transcriptional regulator
MGTREQNEDLSLFEFKVVEYQGANQVVASDEIQQQILMVGIRKLERGTNVSHHTIARILKGEHVRRGTLAKIVTQVRGFESQAARSKPQPFTHIAGQQSD